MCPEDAYRYLLLLEAYMQFRIEAYSMETFYEWDWVTRCGSHSQMRKSGRYVGGLSHSAAPLSQSTTHHLKRGCIIVAFLL